MFNFFNLENRFIAIDLFSDEIKTINIKAEITFYPGIKIKEEKDIEKALKIIFKNFKRKLFRYEIVIIIPSTCKYHKINKMIKKKFIHKVSDVKQILSEICVYTAFMNNTKYYEEFELKKLKKELYVYEHNNQLFGFTLFLREVIGKPVLIKENDSRKEVIKKITNSLPSELPKSIKKYLTKINYKEKIKDVETSWQNNELDLNLYLNPIRYKSFIVNMKPAKNEFRENMLLWGVYNHWVVQIPFLHREFK